VQFVKIALTGYLILDLLTINTHVRSIYSKPGVALRSTAMGWSMVHQLV